MTSAAVLGLSAQGWAHVVTALRSHLRWCQGAAVPVPDEVLALRDLAQKCSATDRHEPTAAHVADVIGEAARMNQRLAFTYDETAELLGTSKRTVERLVADGLLPTVNLGGPRITRADLEQYVESLRSGSTFRQRALHKAARSPEGDAA